jgi:hypothetical protein
MNMFDEPEVRAGRKGMGSHQSADMLKDAWLTPPEIIKPMGAFDLDPCAALNRPWDTASQHYTIIDNGLLKRWSGRVWLNPPYGGPDIVGPWMRRMVEHGHGTALIFARTETALFFEAVWRAATAVLFIEGRLHFHHGARTFVPRLDKWFELGERAEANAGAPSVLVAYGEADAVALRDCGIRGQFVRLIPETTP